MKKYKLGVTYNLFAGEELLESSILSIRSQVDYINVVWQNISWTGEKCSQNLESKLNALEKKGLIDKVIKYENRVMDSGKPGKPYKAQRQKINGGVKDLKRAGCTHAILMDVDEFYNKEEFARAKKYVYDHHITHSVCGIYDYRVSPLYRKRETADYCVGFIFKLFPWSAVLRVNNMPCKIDPFRAFLFIPLIHKFYYLNMVTMRHMTGVRKNYEFKIKNSINNTDISMLDHLEKMLAMQKANGIHV